eukprot:Awhi_evm1s3337
MVRNLWESFRGLDPRRLRIRSPSITGKCIGSGMKYELYLACLLCKDYAGVFRGGIEKIKVLCTHRTRSGDGLGELLKSRAMSMFVSKTSGMLNVRGDLS